MKKLTNKFILTITGDKNDADYITEITKIDAIDSEYFSKELFLKLIPVLKKLVGRLDKTYSLITDDDRKILYDFDTYNQDEDWVEKNVKPIEEFSILDSVRDWDSNVAEFFPIDTEYCYDFDFDDARIKGCHSIKEISLIYINENGEAFEL